MVPIEKVKDIIAQHDTLEKELSSGSIDPKLFEKNLKTTLDLEELFQQLDYLLILRMKNKILKT